MGVVYYGAYLDWFAEGRTDVLRQHGLSYRSWEARGVFLPVIEVNCRYRSPARYDDILNIVTEIASLTPHKIQFDYSIFGPGEKLLAEGFTRHAFIGPDGKPMNLRKRHAELWEWLCAVERKDDHSI